MNDSREPQDPRRSEAGEPEPPEGEGPGRFEGEEQHGYSPDVGRGSEDAARSGERAFRTEHGADRPPREPSREEAAGVEATDTEAASPEGVGTSPATGGEDVADEEEAGRPRKGTKGESERPYGTSTAESATGVAPEEPVDDDSPHIPPAG